MEEVINFRSFNLVSLVLGTMKGFGYYFLSNARADLLFLSSIMILTPSLFELYFDKKIKNIR